MTSHRHAEQTYNGCKSLYTSTTYNFPTKKFFKKLTWYNKSLLSRNSKFQVSLVSMKTRSWLGIQIIRRRILFER